MYRHTHESPGIKQPNLLKTKCGLSPCKLSGLKRI